jgi:phage shock protein C
VTDEPLEPDERAPRAEPEVEPERPTQEQPPPEPPPAPSTGSPRLYRSRDDSVIAGVCGGLGEYLGIDSVLIRIAFVLLIFAGGLGILAYILGWIFIPEAPAEGEVAGATAPVSTFDRAVGPERRSGAVVLGLLFVGLGILFLLDVAWPDFLSWEYAWPIALIAVGVAIVLRTRR